LIQQARKLDPATAGRAALPTRAICLCMAVILAAKAKKLAAKIAALQFYSQLDHLAQHPQAVVNEMNFAAFPMIPTHRNLAQAQSGALREIKELDIESKPLDSRGFQNWPTNIETKSFESALCVPKRKSGCDAREQIENPTGGFATPWLMFANQAAIQRARSKGKIDIVICDRPDHFGSFFKRRGQIGIKKQSDRSLRRRQSFPNSRAFPAVRKIFKQTSFNLRAG